MRVVVCVGMSQILSIMESSVSMETGFITVTPQKSTNNDKTTI